MLDNKIENEIKRLIHDNAPYALELIYNLMGQQIYGYILSIVCSEHEAEDLMHDLFMKIVVKRHRIIKADNFKAYIFRMARNLAMEKMRHNKKEKAFLKNADYLIINEQEEEISDKNKQELHLALLELPIEQKEVITMKIFQEMTFEKISESLGLSINTLASRYRYGMKKLRKILQGRIK